MLNMLIAIMGDTYERVMESKDINAVKTKLEIMGEQAVNIHKLDLFPTKAESAPCDYMYVVKLDDDADQGEAESWEGSIKQMSKLNQQCMQQINANLTKRLDDLQKQAEKSSKRDIAQDQALKKTVYALIRAG